MGTGPEPLGSDGLVSIFGFRALTADSRAFRFRAKLIKSELQAKVGQ